MLPLDVSNYLLIVDGRWNDLSPCDLITGWTQLKYWQVKDRVREHGRLLPFPVNVTSYWIWPLDWKLINLSLAGMALYLTPNDRYRLLSVFTHFCISRWRSLTCPIWMHLQGRLEGSWRSTGGDVQRRRRRRRRASTQCRRGSEEEDDVAPLLSTRKSNRNVSFQIFISL